MPRKYVKKKKSPPNASTTFMCTTGVTLEMNGKRSLSLSVVLCLPRGPNSHAHQIRAAFLAANSVGYVSKCYMFYIRNVRNVKHIVLHYCHKKVMSCIMMSLSPTCKSPFSVTFALLAPQEPQKNKA